MKKLILVLAMVALLVGTAMAADVTLNGRTFTVTAYDQLFLLTFQQGPFGPGEMGIATLSCSDIPPLFIGYAFDEPFCTFTLLSFDTTGTTEITIRYILYGNELHFAPEGAPQFTEQVATE